MHMARVICCKSNFMQRITYLAMFLRTSLWYWGKGRYWNPDNLNPILVNQEIYDNRCRSFPIIPSLSDYNLPRITPKGWNPALSCRWLYNKTGMPVGFSQKEKYGKVRQSFGKVWQNQQVINLFVNCHRLTCTEARMTKPMCRWPLEHIIPHQQGHSRHHQLSWIICHRHCNRLIPVITCNQVCMSDKVSLLSNVWKCDKVIKWQHTPARNE